VYLAGRRETPGVDEQVYAGCDAIAVLRGALDAALGDEGGHTVLAGEVVR
jgi:hypothetical protein